MVESQNRSIRWRSHPVVHQDECVASPLPDHLVEGERKPLMVRTVSRHHPTDHTGRRCLVIAHEPDGLGGQAGVRLAERGIEVDTHIVTADYDQPNVATPWTDWSRYDVIAIMGSLRSLTDKDEISSWIHAELDLIRMAQADDKPMLGVCFGGQLLAAALGGVVEIAPVKEIGWYEIEAAEGADNPVGPGPWMEWHHDRFTPPPGAEVLAENENAVQLFRIGRSIGTQFHPEVDVAHVIGFLRGTDDTYLEAESLTREGILSDMQLHEERNTTQCHALVDWFLDEIAFP